MTQPRSDTALSIGYYVFAYFLTFVLWLLLAGSVQTQEVAAAAIVAVVVTVVAGRRLEILAGVRITPAAPVHLVSYLAYFLVALIRANLDMARRVLSPSLPLRPAVVEVKTQLTSSLGRLILANSITLTPGTLSVDVQDDRILVHWVDCSPGADLEAATAAIVRSFERHITGFMK